MFKGLKNGWDVINASISAFFKHPIFLLPLLTVWIIYAPTIIYFKWHFNWTKYNTSETAAIVFLIIFGFSILLTLSCSILLELVQQKETGNKFNLFKSLKETLTKNIIQIIVLAFFWAILWFILTILEAFLSKRNSSTEKETENAENIARTLSNSGNVTLTSFSFDAMKKGIRMIVFLIMPAFAWENFGIGKSIKRGLSILKQRIPEFVTGYTLSYLAAAIVFIPPAIMFKLSKDHVEFSDGAWVLCIIYIAFAWSYTIYLEQMFTAELYLRQLMWEKDVRTAIANGKKTPKFGKTISPSIVDDNADLIE